MKRFNQNILKAIFEICERKGCFVKVDPEFYQSFVNYSDKEMEAVIECIVRDRAHVIRKKVESSQWNTKEEVYEFIISHLEMVALGILQFREKDLRLVFHKPVGEPPDEEMERKLDKRIRGSLPLIIKKVILKIFQRNLEKNELDEIEKELSARDEKEKELKVTREEINELLSKAKKRGFLYFNEIDNVFPEDLVSYDDFEAFLDELAKYKIEILDARRRMRIPKNKIH